MMQAQSLLFPARLRTLLMTNYDSLVLGAFFKGESKPSEQNGIYF